MKRWLVPAVLAAALPAIACDREERRFREVAPASSIVDAVPVSDLAPGEPVDDVSFVHPYEENAWAIAEGKRLYEWMNCVYCHGRGGGGIGPPLMDDEWIYGSDSRNIAASIVQGRPNGMPSFRGKLTEQQLWQIVAYVRSISGLVPMDAAPGRMDALPAKPPEVMKKEEQPKQSHPEVP